MVCLFSIGSLSTLLVFFEDRYSLTISVTMPNVKSHKPVLPDGTCLEKVEPKKNLGKAILFDLDGVLVDVTASYRKAIQETVRFFTGEIAGLKEIQQLKEKGGYNNDWDLTEAILISRSKSVPKTDVVKRFQELYLGTHGKPGFIENERWLLDHDKLVQLQRKYRLGIVTGRPRAETLYVLKKFSVEEVFDVIVAMEDYPADKAKPDPYPLCLALERLGLEKAVYVGDSVDDIIAAKRAGIEVIGCILPGVATNHLRKLLLTWGAKRVLNSINEIE